MAEKRAPGQAPRGGDGASDGNYLTTNQGVKIGDNQNSLKAGARGPTLMEDLVFREKIMHFDHERIPERVVHARGSGAHGFFQVYEPLAEYTKASFLQHPAVKTPIFVRFSTVAGSRGSADTVRDVRGFATKFYTEDGVFDLVGNNMPVFFIQDAIKFPDFIHAVKPEPDNEIPQASSAHDTFWDFISLTPESMHMIMWVLSDRAIPRSYRMMEGFGVHTFRLINAQGKSRFAKFHWKPLLGMRSLVWDEAQKLSGKDPDYNRRDLWSAIANGDFPEYELGLQIVEESNAESFGFDLLDPTKIIPEELVPVRRVGKMTLNRNPDNFFAETEQVAFHPGHIVPGIDFSDDPLLQGRLFSYLDTQLTRLGGPNFAQIPINRPKVPVVNNQQDGLMQQTTLKGRANYEPNTLAQGLPKEAPAGAGGFVSYPEPIDAPKIRQRSETFADHFSQARLFWNSLVDWEKEHLILAACFELGKVEVPAVRERMVGLFAKVDGELATRVAAAVGVTAPAGDSAVRVTAKSPALSLATAPNDSVRTRQVAILIAEGYRDAELSGIVAALAQAGAQSRIVSKSLGPVKSAEGKSTPVDHTFLTTGSIVFDAVYVPGGAANVATLKTLDSAVEFVEEAFLHGKAIAASGDGVELLAEANLGGARLADAPAGGVVSERGVVTTRESDVAALGQEFIAAIAAHRHFERERKDQGGNLLRLKVRPEAA